MHFSQSFDGMFIKTSYLFLMKNVFVFILLLLSPVVLPTIKDGNRGEDAGDTIHTAMELHGAGTYHGTVSSTDIIDMYKYTAEKYYLTITVEYSVGEISLVVYDESGTEIGEDSTESPLEVSVDSTPGEVFYIKITLLSGSSVAYTITIDEMGTEEIIGYTVLGIIMIALCIIGVIWVVMKISRKREKTVIVSSPQQKPSQQVMQTEIVKTKVLIVCPYCGAKVPEGTLKCPNCGAPL